VNKSDTPETDASADWYLAAAYSTDPDDKTVPVSVSRKLERERNEWAAMCGRYKQERDIAEADATNFHARIFELIDERDAAIEKHRLAVIHWQIGVFKMQRERDEAREAFKISYNERVKVELERDEARAELADWKDSAKNVRKEYDDEHHCSCVAILRKLLKDAECERDEWAAMCGRYKQERDEALANEISFHHRTHSELVEAQCKLLDAKYYDQLKS